MIDLHVHSNRSDGSYSPSQLVDYAIEKGLTAFALTDHDTVDGLDEAVSYAKRLREQTKKPVPEIIPGVELSTEYPEKDVHIVGLFIDYHNKAFTEYLKNFIASRHTRNEKMCALLSEAGVDISYEKLQAQFPGAVITRAHYAKYLYQNGYTKSIREGFERYVGDHCPYFVPRKKVTPAQAVELILQADGLPVLAHPILYGLSSDRLEALVRELKSVGLIGIEAVYSSYTQADERQIRRLASKYHLLISGGSDFHGANKPGLDLATGYGRLYVPEQILETMKKSRGNLFFFDMDGTLLRQDSTVSPAVKTALDRIHAQNDRMILCSGRPLPSILEVMEKTGLRYPGQLVIAFNGALIYDCDKKKPIRECLIRQADIAVLVNAAAKHGLHIHGYSQDRIVCRSLNEEIKFYTRRIHLSLTCVTDIAEALPDGSYKLLCISLDDHEKLEAFRAETEPLFDGRIRMMFSNQRYLEILPAGVGKGPAARFAADYLSVPLSHTIAAGDEENDISLLQTVRTGVAMQNAAPAVKEAADIVTEKDNNEDGILEILERYL